MRNYVIAGRSRFFPLIEIYLHLTVLVKQRIGEDNRQLLLKSINIKHFNAVNL